MTLNLKWVNKFKAWWNYNPRAGKPRVKSQKEWKNYQLVTMKDTGEDAAVVGPWIRKGLWDGSYIVFHNDGTIGYWFETKFNWTGLTLGEAIELRSIKEDIKKKRGQKEKERSAS